MAELYTQNISFRVKDRLPGWFAVDDFAQASRDLVSYSQEDQPSGSLDVIVEVARFLIAPRGLNVAARFCRKCESVLRSNPNLRVPSKMIHKVALRQRMTGGGEIVVIPSPSELLNVLGRG